MNTRILVLGSGDVGSAVAHRLFLSGLRAGQKLLEVDPRPQPDTHGLGGRPAAIARGVLRALGLRPGLDDAFLEFEASYRETMDCIPMRMRHKLDRCGFKLSLEQWRTLPRTVREALLEAPDSPRHIQRLHAFLRRRAQQSGWPEGTRVGSNAAVDHLAAMLSTGPKQHEDSKGTVGATCAMSPTLYTA